MLVTGAAGFIGSNLAKRLAKDGHDVIAADSFLSADFHNLVDFPGDVLTLKDHDDVQSMIDLGPVDVIFHQASITGVVGAKGEDYSDVHRMMRNNVETFRKLLDWAAATGSRVVWASSCSIYGRGPVPMRESQPPDPLNSYAFSKLTMERLAARYAPRLAHPIVGLRYTNAYGPGEQHKGKLASMIRQLATQMTAGKRPRIFEFGEQKRDFVYIDDVTTANLLAAKAARSGVYNVGAGRSWTFNAVVAELNRVLKTDLQPDYFKNPYTFTQDWTEADLTHARADLKYEPAFDLAKGIDAYHASGQMVG
ncbi:MAG TPA: NAD-dependent epimerase/dehydratase family protein [Tepidisphaeraceae bacterium]|nr:NAD-dependent epimerase/dehydratase family protein [Tepidisphaeraceae bacterium]